MSKNIFSLGVAFLSGASLLVSVQALAEGKKCLHVSSYSSDYEWAAGIDSALWKQLGAKCAEKKSLWLDGKVHPERVPQKALEAKAVIEAMKPDVVVVSDDLAVKYLLQGYYKDAKIPFVFCGLNWSAVEYGLPYANATGLIEINAIEALVDESMRVLPRARKAYCLAEPSETGRKLCGRLSQRFKRSGVEVVENFPAAYPEWEKNFLAAQSADYDFVLLPVVHAVKNFDFEKAGILARTKTKKLTMSLYNWMVPFSILSFVTPPEEQGEYAGSVAGKILDGAKPSDFPIVTNRKWDLIINTKLADSAKVKLPPSLLRKATKVSDR